MFIEMWHVEGFNVGAIAVSYVQYGHCMWRDALHTILIAVISIHIIIGSYKTK